MYNKWGWYIIFKTMRHLFKTYYSYNYVLKQGKTIKWNSFRTWTMDSGGIKRGFMHLLLQYFNSQSNFIQMAINHSDIRTRFFL